MPDIAVDASPLAGFARYDRSLTRFGELEWRGGLVLTSPDPRFGGWSGLILDRTGTELVAVSDRQAWMRATLVHDGETLAGLVSARLGDFRPRDPAMKGIGHDRDAEAIALISGSFDKGQVLVSFERKNRLARLSLDGDTFSDPLGFYAKPPEARDFPENLGFEAATVLRGGPDKGAVVAIAEDFPDASGHHSGWIWIGGAPQRFALTRTPFLAVTDAASLDDGSLIILERRAGLMGGFAMRLRYIRPGAIRPGAILEGEVLMEAGLGHEVDNMEALAVHRNSKGETILTLMSDNNFSAYLQRSLVLQFALSPAFAPEPP